MLRRRTFRDQGQALRLHAGERLSQPPPRCCPAPPTHVGSLLCLGRKGRAHGSSPGELAADMNCSVQLAPAAPLCDPGCRRGGLRHRVEEGLEEIRSIVL